MICTDSFLCPPAPRPPLPPPPPPSGLNADFSDMFLYVNSHLLNPHFLDPSLRADPFDGEKVVRGREVYPFKPLWSGDRARGLWCYTREVTACRSSHLLHRRIHHYFDKTKCKLDSTAQSRSRFPAPEGLSN